MRVLPYNIEAEEAVIGSLMLDLPALARIRPILAPGDFYREAHQWLYIALCDLYDQGKVIDALTLSDEMDRREKLAAVGGRGGVTRLMASVPTAMHVQHYAEIVAEDATRRAIIGAGERIAAAAYGEGPLADVVAVAEREVAAATHRRSSGAICSLADAGRRSTERLRALHNQGDAAGMPIALPSLKRAIGHWRRKEMTVIAAYTSIGKTAFALAEALHLAGKGYHGLIFSLEQSDTSMADRAKGNLLMIDSAQLRNGWNKGDDTPHKPRRVASAAELEAASERGNQMLEALPLAIDETPGYRPSDIEALATSHRERTRRLDFIVIDYLTLMNMGNVRKASERSLAVGQAALAMREMAKRLDCHVFLVHQLSREAAQSRPQLWMLAQSVDIERHTDQALLLWVPDGEPGALTVKVEFIIAKQRDGGLETCDDIYTERDTGRFWCSAFQHQQEPEGFRNGHQSTEVPF